MVPCFSNYGGNKPGNPLFFFQIFAKKSLINNILFGEEKKFDSRT